MYTAESPFVPGADASTNDDGGGVLPPDGGTDASDGRRFCEAQNPAPTFCRDFDDGAPLYFGFDYHAGEDGDVVDFDPTQHVSAPRSLSLSLPAGALPLRGCC